jgi:subtilisin family serine protease
MLTMNKKSVSAGNSGINTDAFSPSSEPKAFTVGATDRNDNITYFSNYGALVDLFAPGSEINSTWIGAPDAWVSLLLYTENISD